MTRLADDLIAHGAMVAPAHRANSRRVSELTISHAYIRALLSGVTDIGDGGPPIPPVPVIVHDDVTRYFYLVSDEERIDWRTLPCLIPPFPVCWLEGRLPDQGRSKETGGQLVPLDRSMPSCVGVAVHVAHRTREPDRFAQLVDGMAGSARTQMQPDDPGHETLRALDKGVGVYFLELSSWLQNTRVARADQIVGPTMLVGMALDADGRALDLPFFFKHDDVVHGADLHNAPSVLFDPALLALSLMHCKNVTLREAPPLPAKVLAKRVARGVRPGVRYSTVVVDQIQSVLRHARRDHGGAGIARALHQVRGHFKTYTAEKPLLGRHVGRYFWAQQARGDRSRGEVRARYDVRGPDHA